MNSLPSFLSVNRPCDQSLEWLRLSLAKEGLSLMRTFDLQDARVGAGECPCPEHGTEKCNCQMIVVLIYGQGKQPATLVLHGSDERTWLSLVNSPVQPVDPATRRAIEHALGAGGAE